MENHCNTKLWAHTQTLILIDGWMDGCRSMILTEITVWVVMNFIP